MKLAPDHPLPEHASVVAAEDLPTGGISKGTHGAIVYVHEAGTAYEVEFFDDEEQTLDVVTVEPHQVQLFAPAAASARRSA